MEERVVGGEDPEVGGRYGGVRGVGGVGISGLGCEMLTFALSRAPPVIARAGDNTPRLLTRPGGAGTTAGYSRDTHAPWRIGRST